MSGGGPARTGGPAAGEAELALHVDFYPEEAVERTAAAFAGVADCAVGRDGPYLRVRLRRRDGAPADRLRREFANYALVAGASAPSP